MKIDLNNLETLEHLYTCSTLENARYYGVTIRAVEKAKTSQKFVEYRTKRTIETAEKLSNATETAVNALISLLESENERIVLETAKTIIGYSQGVRTDISELRVERVLVAIKETAEKETKKND